MKLEIILNRQKAKEIIKNFKEVEYKVFSDSDYDNQIGVNSHYFDKNSWIEVTIEMLRKEGWEFYRRIPNQYTVFSKRHSKEELVEALELAIEVKKEK